jgi:hypothetical protein
VKLESGGLTILSLEYRTQLVCGARRPACHGSLRYFAGAASRVLDEIIIDKVTGSVEPNSFHGCDKKANAREQLIPVACKRRRAHFKECHRTLADPIVVCGVVTLPWLYSGKHCLMQLWCASRERQRRVPKCKVNWCCAFRTDELPVCSDEH